MDPCSLPTCLKLGLDPIAIHAGGFALYWYGLLVAAGFIVAIRIGSGEADRTGINPDQLLSATLVAALFGLLLARVFYVLQNQPQYYIDGKHLGDALSLWQGGLTFYGGIFGAILGTGLYCGRYRLPLLRFLDIGGLVAPLGVAIGRVGNFINGDITGLNTNNFGVEYTSSNNLLVPTEQVGRTQHPLALYDLAWELTLFAVLFVLWRRRVLRPGQVAGIYLFGYGAGQLVLGAFRAAPAGVAGLKAAQLTALPVVAAGLWLFIRGVRQGATYAAVPAEVAPARRSPTRKPTAPSPIARKPAAGGGAATKAGVTAKKPRAGSPGAKKGPAKAAD